MLRGRGGEWRRCGGRGDIGARVVGGGGGGLAGRLAWRLQCGGAVETPKQIHSNQVVRALPPVLCVCV